MQVNHAIVAEPWGFSIWKLTVDKTQGAVKEKSRDQVGIARVPLEHLIPSEQLTMKQAHTLKRDGEVVNLEKAT